MKKSAVKKKTGDVGNCKKGCP